MSAKSCDQRGRWRNVTIGFRVSPEENHLINEIVALSGMTKQEYIVKKLLNREVIVEKSPRTHKMLKDKMDEIVKELRRMHTSEECSEDFLDTLRLVTGIWERTKD